MHGQHKADQYTDRCAEHGPATNHHWGDESLPRVILLINNESEGSTDESSN